MTTAGEGMEGVHHDGGQHAVAHDTGKRQNRCLFLRLRVADAVSHCMADCGVALITHVVTFVNVLVLQSQAV